MEGYQVRTPGLADDRDKRKVDDFSGLYGLDNTLRPHPEHAGGEGAFKKLKTEGGSGGVAAGHSPTTSACPTPARRRHRTTFSQVSELVRAALTPAGVAVGRGRFGRQGVQ
ncbi:uncharacterized protein LOC119094439 [Pollicipes pollicipes]|uniref:uncharacterized protein LOC119094439 n=1 Tax=Pollicipes pollicipes TaxID=41117 RepID=UPI001884AD52|nr:uncharacterized protein LOC119094439 [Pollicipes pollicipes]